MADARLTAEEAARAYGAVARELRSPSSEMQALNTLYSAARENARLREALVWAYTEGRCDGDAAASGARPSGDGYPDDQFERMMAWWEISGTKERYSITADVDVGSSGPPEGREEEA